MGVVFSIAVGLYFSCRVLKLDSTAAFYLTPFRFHEFALGGLVAIFNNRYKYKLPIFVCDFGLMFGLLVLSYSIFFFSTHTLFPGLNALIPVFGAMCVIFFCDKSRFKALLSNRIMRYTGEISYSLYLIHWPLYVFIQYVIVRDLTAKEKLLIFISTYVISMVMCKYIEKPFRNPNIIKASASSFSLGCTVFCLAITLVASSSWANRGWVWRLPEQIRKINDFDLKAYENYVWDKQVKLAKKQSFKLDSEKKLLIIGDSQSADIVNIMKESGQLERFDIMARTISYECGTPFVEKSLRSHFFKVENLVTSKSPQIVPLCESQMDHLFDNKDLASADSIFISMKWESYSLPYLNDFIQLVRENSKAKIFVFGNKNLDKSSIEIVNLLGRTSGIEEYAYSMKNPSVSNLIDSMKGIQGIEFINMMNMVCPDKGRCHVLDQQLNPIFFDSTHLTRYGAIYFGDDFRNNVINKI